MGGGCRLVMHTISFSAGEEEALVWQSIVVCSGCEAFMPEREELHI